MPVTKLTRKVKGKKKTFFYAEVYTPMKAKVVPNSADLGSASLHLITAAEPRKYFGDITKFFGFDFCLSTVDLSCKMPPQKPSYFKCLHVGE